MGQWIVIAPSKDRVVVRMGFFHADDDQITSVAQLIRDVVNALHAGS